MTRLIDADALIELLAGMQAVCHTHAELVGISKVWQQVKNMPTVDAEPHWIPCSERLPEDDRTKVVALANGITEAGYYSNGDWWCIGDTVTLENPTVIAWIPLPEPFEVDE